MLTIQSLCDFKLKHKFSIYSPYLIVSVNRNADYTVTYDHKRENECRQYSHYVIISVNPNAGNAVTL